MKLFVVAFLALALPGGAQSTAPKPWKELSIHSRALGADRPVFVVTPKEYSDSRKAFGVLVLLDAEDEQQFASAIANVAYLTNRGATPPLIIVGVPNGKDRTHDLTPPAVGDNAKTFPTAGGASRFVDFILDEALPTIRANYRTRPLTVLAGHSFGGLTALHAAATRNAFAGIIAMSPSLWWNDSAPAFAYADSIARMTRPLRLFASSGEYETLISSPTGRFAARLDSIKPATLAFAYRHYATDDHQMTPLHSLVDGLMFAFGPMSLVGTPISRLTLTSDSAALVKAFSETRANYAAGAQSFGMPSSLPEGMEVEFAGWVLELWKLPAVARTLFTQSVADYPQSPAAHAGLADSYLALGDTASAQTHFRHAIAAAKAAKLPADSATERKLRTISKRR